MSKISDIFDDMNSEIAALLPGATQFPDVLSLDTQPTGYLTFGFGVVFGPAVNTNRELGCKLSIQRSMAVVLTRLIGATDTDTGAFSAAQKQILEDQFLLIRNWEQEVTLANGKAKILFSGDGGLEVLSTQDQAGRFFVLTSDFSVEYFEDITP